MGLLTIIFASSRCHNAACCKSLQLAHFESFCVCHRCAGWIHAEICERTRPYSPHDAVSGTCRRPRGARGIMKLVAAYSQPERRGGSVVDLLDGIGGWAGARRVSSSGRSSGISSGSGVSSPRSCWRVDPQPASTRRRVASRSRNWCAWLTQTRSPQRTKLRRAHRLCSTGGRG